MKKICAITGSNGYVGGCLKHHLVAQDWEIRELTRAPRPGTSAVAFQLGADFPPESLAGVAAVIHCAYDFKPVRWEEIRTVNVEGSRKFLEAARAAGVPKIVCLSSISAFDGCRSLYGRAKLEIEKIALANGALVIRPGLVYGDDAGGMFGKLAAQVRKASVVPMIGDGSQIQFLVHNADLCAFSERYIDGTIELSPMILTAAHGQPWPFKRLLLEIARRLGKNPKFVPLPWRLVWLGLKSAEVCGLRLNFRSDSLVSLMNQIAAPDLSANPQAGLECRPFEIEKLKI